jgi:cyanophycin synthetase
MSKNNDILKNIRSLSTVLLAKEAMERNIEVKHINKHQKEMSFLELSYKNHFEYIIGQSSSKTSAPARYAGKNKALTKSLLSRAKINVTKGKLFHKDKISEARSFIKEIGYPIVIKPVDGAHGNLVFIGLSNKKDCDMAIKKIFQEKNFVLVEKEFKGKEFRFITTASKVLAVTYRDPANVVGDGIHNMRELIKIKNKDPKRGEKTEKPLTKIKIDNITKQNLVEQNIKLDYIPTKGKKIYLRKESNISTGGDSIDVTDIVHPELKKIAIMSVKAIPGLAYAGVDLMTNKDILKKPTKNSYIIVELNSSPGIDPQHFPYQGKPRNVAKGIIDILFPETKK